VTLLKNEIESAMATLREPRWPRAETTAATKTPPPPKARREEFSRRQPCFHCSKSLKMTNGSRPATYVGFVLNVDGFDRVLHQTCIADFVAGVLPAEMEDTE
jgi:hypothetical protein